MDGYSFLTMDMSCQLITGSCHWRMTWWTDPTKHSNLIVSLSLNCSAFYCQVFCFLDHEIMLFPGTGRMPWGHQPSLHNWVIIKVSYRYLRKYLLNCMYQDWDFPSV